MSFVVNQALLSLVIKYHNGMVFKDLDENCNRRNRLCRAIKCNVVGTTS